MTRGCVPIFRRWVCVSTDACVCVYIFAYCPIRRFHNHPTITGAQAPGLLHIPHCRLPLHIQHCRLSRRHRRSVSVGQTSRQLDEPQFDTCLRPPRYGRTSACTGSGRRDSCPKACGPRVGSRAQEFRVSGFGVRGSGSGSRGSGFGVRGSGFGSRGSASSTHVRIC